MTILVTGASGFVGRHLLKRLTGDVRAAVRTPAGYPDEVVVGDIGPKTDWSAALQGVDRVVHLAGRAHVLRESESDPLATFDRVNVEGTRALAEAAAMAGVRRFVFVSSIGVSGQQTHGRPLTADAPPAPHAPYAVSKLKAEQVLREIEARSGMECVIIRPPLVTGQGAKGNLGLLDHAIARRFPLPLGSITGNRRDFVSVDNLVGLIQVCLDHPAAPGRIFLASDGASVSTRQFVEQRAAALGVKPRLIPVPPVLLNLTLKLLGRGGMATQLLGDLEVDIGAAHRLLGWSPASPS
jgi:nucleoside-diphosphate-sugar epimerase